MKLEQNQNLAFPKTSDLPAMTGRIDFYHYGQIAKSKLLSGSLKAITDHCFFTICGVATYSNLPGNNVDLASGQ